ncbi:hypothetical protein BpHYR1_036226 [Brachionus plicatilis]|uniref:Uncharacterized protein n=1 Tax=Brachionus plicatilis TaxID=10195 RepID=A0A3M7S3T5_BRAPC|nr:hypothetical protein BpHYR1_036226 [Brachionus plicatilis]
MLKIKSICSNLCTKESKLDMHSSLLIKIPGPKKSSTFFKKQTFLSDSFNSLMSSMSKRSTVEFEIISRFPNGLLNGRNGRKNGLNGLNIPGRIFFTKFNFKP